MKSSIIDMNTNFIAAPRKQRFTSQITDPTVTGADMDARTFKKHKKQYAEFKLKILEDFSIKDKDSSIYTKLMACKSFIEMDRVARSFIEASFGN